MDPVLVRIPLPWVHEPLELRWYGLFFATGLLLCAWRAPHYFRRLGLPRIHAEHLTLWIPVGMLLGAHYIHLIFYETEGLFDFPHFDDDGRFVIGRFFGLGSGLASHGGGLGCVLALLAFWERNGRRLGLNFHRYADAVMVTSIWVYPWVRLGNFFNSEIVGRPTDGPLGVIFEHAGYTEPRHAVVLYEATLYFLELAFATWLLRNYANRLREGVMFYGLLALHFSLRFFCEFFKDSQHVDEGWVLNMGHLLSAPIVVVCGAMILFTKRFSVLTPLSDEERARFDALVAANEVREIEADRQAEAERRGEKLEESAAAAPKPKKGKKSGKKGSSTAEADR